MAPLEADIPQVVRELCLSLDNFWFSVHLLDLLHHDGRERPAQHSHSDVQGAWHESASKLEQRRSNGLGAQVSGLEVHHLLADKILAEYSTSGTFSSTDLNSPGASIVVSDRLTFLGKYREFYKLVEESEFGEAATLLHSLLWSKLAPKYFLVTLLIHHLQDFCVVEEG